MPPKSKKQERFMAAVANNPKFANKVGVPKNVGAKFMKKKPKKNYMGGGMMKRYNTGGKLEMVEKDGKKVPFYAADGKGKMRAGGKVMKYQKGRGVRFNEKELDIGSSREMRPGENPKRAFARRMDEAGGFDKLSDQGKREMLFDMQEGFRDKKRSNREKRYQGRPAPKPKKMMGGGKVKKGYKNGGKVRGCGMARQGVRPAKMVKMKGA